jgi:hypothetical protein
MNFEQGPRPEKSKKGLIELPKDEAVVEKLRTKLEEYKTRLQNFKSPEQNIDTVCKVKVLETLLEAGTVDIPALEHEMEEEYGTGFSERAFMNACGVIEDYASTGGAYLRGGTGLEGNKDEQEEVEVPEVDIENK